MDLGVVSDLSKGKYGLKKKKRKQEILDLRQLLKLSPGNVKYTTCHNIYQTHTGHGISETILVHRITKAFSINYD